MKKVILSAALLVAALGAQAQMATFVAPSTGIFSENDITCQYNMELPDWIDLDNDDNQISTNLPTTWNHLNNGWEFPAYSMTLSSSRKAQIRVMADDVRREDHSASNDAGFFFPASELSLSVREHPSAWTETVKGSLWNGANHDYGQSSLPTTGSGGPTDFSTAQQVLVTDHGVYGMRYQWTLAAFKVGALTNNTGTPIDGANNRPDGEYYNYNLNGDNVEDYVTTVRFEATLN